MPEQIRQLAVIMFTDIVGYTAMMGDDESKAFSLLKVNRKLHKKWIDRYNGKWLKEMGDGVLASFTSVSDAIYCAGAIQRECKEIPDLKLRIGIHLGEVIVEVGDVFGDGVNIASRIESQAEAGSIYVSDSVYRNITNKKGIIAAFIREEVLKNVKHPVRIYKVDVELPDELPADTAPEPEGIRNSDKKTTTKPSWKRPAMISAIAIVILAIGYFLSGWINGGTLSGNHDGLSTVIVLPFENLGSTDDDYFAKGITDEITSRLSMIKGISIISPLSAARFKESGMTIQDMANELDVDFVLDGSIRWDKAGEFQKVRITPRLTSISSQRQVWTNNYDRNLEQIFEVQSEIAEKVSQALDITLLQSDRQSLQVKLTDNIQAYDLYLQGIDAGLELTPAKVRMSQELFEEAIALDSDFAAAYARLGTVHADMWWHYFDRDSTRLLKAKACIDKANELNPELFEVKLASGNIHYHGFREYDQALEHLFEALEMKPRNSEVLSTISFIKRRQGLYQEAIEYLLKGYELDPLSSLIPYTLGETYAILRDYEKAEDNYDKALQIAPDWSFTYTDKASTAYLATGDVKNSINILQGAASRGVGDEVAVFELANYFYLDGAYENAFSELDKLAEEGITEQFNFYSKSLLTGDIFKALGQPGRAMEYYDSALQYTESLIRKEPREEKFRSTLGMIYARLGMKEEAIREGILATLLMPESLDAWAGYTRQTDLARIYALVGEQEQSLKIIDYLLSIPGDFSKAVLERDPRFDNLRGTARYQEIIRKQS